MTITNGYTTLPLFKDAVGVDLADTVDDPTMEASIEAASRQLDDHCGKGRKFWQDGTAVARLYYPRDQRRVYVDDISTVTGLIVKVDQGDDGTYETTLTIGTDFIVEPVNAAAEYPIRPYTSIRLLNNTLSSWPCLTSGRAPVQVTAKYGWPVVPAAVERACVMQARQILKSPSATFGVVQMAMDGSPIRIPSLDPTAKALVESVVRYLEVNDDDLD